jgi:hypothetical protein
MAEQFNSPGSPANDGVTTSSIKRFRIGFNVILQAVLMLALVGVINMIGCKRYAQWDRTPTKQYSLSDQTVNILQALQDDVHITMAFNRESDVYNYTTRMLELFEQSSGGKLKLRRIDPARDPSAILELQNQDPKLYFEQSKILVGKYAKLLIDNPDKPGEQMVAPYQIVTDQDMFQRAESEMLGEGRIKRGRVVEYRLENALTSAILSATQERKQVAYIVTNKGGLRESEPGVNAGSLLMLYGGSRQNLEVTPYALHPNQAIPKDASVVMLIAPKQDLSDEELEVLFKDYWEGENGGLIILFDPKHYDVIPRLRKYLENNYGIGLNDDRVLTMKSEGGRNRPVYEVTTTFMPGSPITEPLEGRTTVLPFQSSSINTKLTETGDLFSTRDLSPPKPLMFAYGGFWKENDYRKDVMVQDVREDLDLHLAVSIEKGAGTNPNLRLNSSRMVVVGNGNLIDPDKRVFENIEFILNSINWASDRDELVAGIATKSRGNFRVVVGERPFGKLEWMTRILPLSVFFLGIVVAFLRRR